MYRHLTLLIPAGLVLLMALGFFMSLSNAKKGLETRKNQTNQVYSLMEGR